MLLTKKKGKPTIGKSHISKSLFHIIKYKRINTPHDSHKQ